MKRCLTARGLGHFGEVATLSRRALFVLVALAACTPATSPTREPISRQNHTWFPIDEGQHALEVTTKAGETMHCESCHPPAAASFTEINCIGCHAHEPQATNLAHTSVADYSYTSTACFACHPTGTQAPFDHAGVQSTCAICHDEGNAFAALPVPNLTHLDVGATECSACHTTTRWQGATAGGPAGLTHDPAQSLSVDSLIPTYSGASISRVSPQTHILKMEMSHTTKSVGADAFRNCTNCHPSAAAGQFFPGVFHGSLNDLGIAGPTACADCHLNASPSGFVGPLATKLARTPATGEMKHDAVSWANNTPTTTAVVTADCASCHASPSASLDGWAVGLDGGAVAYHAALNVQPASCLDCHANSRPAGLLTSPGAMLPAGLSFDHTAAETMGECATCHASTTVWSGGKFHATTSAPATCSTCHEGERPTSTSGWVGTTWQQIPFDYVTNSASITHGAGADCAVCHQDTQKWVGGSFTHGPTTLSARACITCHTTQRPDLALAGTMSTSQVATLLGFDHAINGRGECFACHQATASANRYSQYFNASGTLPGGDWRDGGVYPGDVFAASLDQFIKVNEITLNRSLPANLVTSMSTKLGVPYYNGMLHVSEQVPAVLNAGPTSSPNSATCWHCHTNTAGTVTAYSGGKFHDALTNYTATVGGPVTPLAQPTKCNDCHKDMRPSGIVEKSDAGVATMALQPMDHRATFTTTVTIDGAQVSGVAGLDCATCHATPGKTWGDGVFHSKIGTAVPADCTTCHYPLMAEPAKADLANANGSRMAHRSGLVTFQDCQTCHAGALAKASTMPITSTLFSGGLYHNSLTTQPTACVDCHANSDPTTTKASTVTYAFAQGGTATNGPQLMSHTAATVNGKDCAVCHLADAKKIGAAWSKSTPFHAVVTMGVTTCQGCHGLTNGLGTVIGTNNNLPAGLTNSTSVSSAAGVAMTGIPAGTFDQITHTDLNVSSRDCNVCHTQVGPSKVAGVMGKEWAKATFHPAFTVANPLITNGTTARCSNCHLNLKPGAAFTQRDHSTFTATSAQDCNACHEYPTWVAKDKPHGDTGTTAGSSLGCASCHGSAGVDPTVHLTVPEADHYGGTTNTCITCHINYAGFKTTTTNLLYGHTGFSQTATTNCSVCHTFKSALYTALTDTAKLNLPTAGNSHQFSQTTNVTGRKDESFTSTHQNTNMTDCSACHRYTSTTSATNVWSFAHQGTQSKRSKTSGRGANGCSMCHEHQ